MFPFHYNRLLCLVCCWGQFCQFVLVDSTIRLPCLLDLFLLISAHVHTGVCLSNCTAVSLHMLKCSCAHTVSCLFMYCSFAGIGHADIMRSIVSSNCWQSLHLLSVSAFNIFVAQYSVCNARSCATNISLSVSAFKSPFDSQMNVSSSPISCLCF